MISERAMRAVLVVIGVLNAASGALALIAPDTFFDQVGHYGVENSHYVGDVGAFVLAFGIAVLVAAWRPTWRVPVLALGAIWYGLHALNHAFDVGQARSDARGIFDTAYIAISGLLLAYLAWVAARPEAAATDGKEGEGMKVFVAGASGVIGRPLVRQLVAAQHEVTGMTSKAENAAAVEAAGATAVVCDALDAEAVEVAVRDAGPEVVISQLTRLPHEYNPRKIDYGPTNRARAVGGHNLIEAARAAGVSRFVTQSVAFIYAPEGEMIKDEEARPWTDAPEPFRRGAGSTLEHEREATQTPGLDGVVLRYGQFYGPGTYYAHRREHRRAGASAPLSDRWSRRGNVLLHPHRRRRLGHGRIARARGTRHLQRRRRRAGAIAGLAARLRGGARRAAAAPSPRRSWPGWSPGPFAAAFATQLRGASNAKAKRELGWEPRYPSWRRGFREALG